MDFRIFLSVLSFITFCISLYFIFGQVKLETFSIFGAIIIAINFLTFILSRSIIKVQKTEINYKGLLKYSFSILLLFCLGMLFYITATNYNLKNSPAKSSFIIDERTSVQNVIMKYSTTNKPVKITVVVDYACPFCRYLIFHLNNLIVDYQNDVELIFLFYPIKSTLPVRAAILARDYGKFDFFHNKMYLHQELLDSLFILGLANKCQINPELFSSRLNTPKITNDLADYIETAKKLDCKGLPTLFINNNLVEEWYNPNQIKYLVNLELSKYNLNK
jgi:hypothetical protein